MVDNVPNVGMGDNAHLRRIRNAYLPSEPTQAADEVQISSQIKNLQAMQGIRMEMVLEVRRAIQNGTFLTPEKLDRSLDRAIDDARGQ